MREIKFRIIHRNEIIGIERVGERGWEWMDYRLNPDKGERWSQGSYPHTDKGYKRSQYTGLKDKNGKEIYEGDIVKCGKSNDAQLATICFRQQAFILRYLPHSTKDTDDVYDYMEDYKHFKVIGNTCENPDLLTNPPIIK